jgi:lipid II:glycine glycyltransferase (peptidoglycan interpeptide bridge formation enzyme)
MGQLEDLGQVVNIDLNAPVDLQWSHVSRRFRSYINKARKTYRVREAETEDDLERFIALYEQTMKRLKAHPRYYFKRDYYSELWHSKSFRTRILMAEDRDTGQVVSAAMFVICCTMVQYHLSGTDGAYTDLHPVKLLIDEMRLLATREGKQYFNLGGGIGGSKDSLFDFKSRFSKDYREFFIWKFIANEEMYRQLSEKHIRKGCNKDPMLCKEFFPCYRCDAIFTKDQKGHGDKQ